MSNPALDYALSVLTGETPACEYVKLACHRFLKDLDRTDIWYDESAAEKFYTFCSYLKHYKGPTKGTPIELEPWQKFIFGNIYGWKLCQQVGDEWVHTDVWRFKYNYIEVPRKNGKTTITAAAAAYDCAFVEDLGAEVYCLATKEDQARILWNDVRAFIKQSDEMKDVFEVLEGRITIFAKNSERTSFVRPLGSNSERLDGLNPISAICDELHEWPDRKLLEVIEGSFGARSSWHILQITTAGTNRQGVCYQERKHGIDILEGRIPNDDKFVIIFTVDEEDRTNHTRCLTDESIWFKANPNLGKGKQMEYMRSRAAKAREIPSQLNPFLNKQLDIWTDSAEAWLKWDLWQKSHREFTRKTLKGKKCIMGGDLAKVMDLSAVSYWFPIQPGLDKIHLLLEFYCPAFSVKARSERDKVPYDVWVRQGWIQETPGETTDFSFILKDILDNRAYYEIAYGAFDRTFGGELIQGLMNEGMEIVTAGQGFLSMGPAMDEFERLLVKQEIVTNANPVLDWCSNNVVFVRDPAGNRKPDKSQSPDKIDGIVASLNALIGILDKTRKEPPKKTAGDIYTRRGMRSLGE